MPGVLCYCIGGGLGHIVRTLAVLDAKGWRGDAALMTATPDPVSGGVPVIEVPMQLDGDRDATRRWLAEQIEELRPDALLLDAFPAGVLGELCDFAALDGLEVHHVARLLRWDAYRGRVTGRLPRYASVAAVEPLHADHAAAFESVEALHLPPVGLRPLEIEDEAPWVVVHSGPASEVEYLARLAEERRRVEAPGAALRVATRAAGIALPEGAELVDLAPADPSLARAARIFSACGFNTMRELRELRDRHVFVPMRRALDDQFERARRAAR